MDKKMVLTEQFAESTSWRPGEHSETLRKGINQEIEWLTAQINEILDTEGEDEQPDNGFEDFD